MTDLTLPLYLGEICEPQGGRRSHRRPPSRGVTNSILAFAVVVALAGIAGLGWVFYQPYAHQGETKEAQSQLQQMWDEPPVPVLPGETPTPLPPGQQLKGPPSGPGFTPIARMSIPRLGLTWFIIEGVDEDDIRFAPGHYPGSAMPGRVGNFAVAGHREKSMFYDIDRMKVGDQILLETHVKRYTYTVRSNKVTKPTAIPRYVSSVPPGFTNGSRVLTLTTCEPKWDNYERLIVQAELTSTTPI